MSTTGGQIPETHSDLFELYYQDCISPWSGKRYALDKLFVHLTLLLVQEEDAPGPRWPPVSETCSDLR